MKSSSLLVATAGGKGANFGPKTILAVRAKHVLRTGTDAAAWDHSKAETPTVVRLPPALATSKRRWLMMYCGGNDKAARPPGFGHTWYQLGAAFSSDGERFQKLPAIESPYANTSTPYGNGSLEGLVFLGRDAFPGTAGITFSPGLQNLGQKMCSEGTPRKP